MGRDIESRTPKREEKERKERELTPEEKLIKKGV